MAIPMRLIVVIIVLLSAGTEYITRLNINLAMVSMVIPENKTGQIIYDACTPPDHKLLSSPNTTDDIDYSHRYAWTPKQQGIILGAYFYSYVTMQLPAGRVAEMFGAKWVILVGLIGSGLINAITPLIASNSKI